jgi:hypothetical protein
MPKVLLLSLLSLLVLPEAFGQNLHVQSDPTRAFVILDGVTVGSTPLQLSKLRIGQHVVVIQKPGFVDHVDTVSISADSTVKLRVVLEHPPVREANTGVAGLHITTRPDSARVFLNGLFVGLSPVSLDTLPPGIHTVTVSKRWYLTEAYPIKLEEGKLAALHALLIPNTGTVGLQAEDARSEIAINHTVVGSGRVDSLLLFPDSYLFEVRDAHTGRKVQAVLDVEPSITRFYEARFGARSTWKTLRGIVLPGVNQIADGAFAKGGMLLTLACGSAGYLVSQRIVYADRKNQVDQAWQFYQEAPNDQEANARKATFESLNSDLNKISKRCTYALGGVVVIWGLNLVDVILHHSFVDDIVEISMNQQTGSVGEIRVSLAMRVSL